MPPFYQDELISIFCSDCLDILKTIADQNIDLIITSPPYNKGESKQAKKRKGEWNKSIRYDIYRDAIDRSDYVKWQKEVITECLRVLKPTGHFFYNHKNIQSDNRIITPWEYVIDFLPYLKQEIIWDRKGSPQNSNTGFIPTTEKIFWFMKTRTMKESTYHHNPRLSEVWADIPPQPEPNHPAPFPQKLTDRLVSMFSKQGDLIMDPFMGIGTTGISCVKSGRKFIGIDISAKYCQVAKDAMIAELNQGKFSL